MLARTTRFAGANATAGDTRIETRSPAPIGRVAVVRIRIPKRLARSFIAITVVTAVAGLPELQNPRLVLAAVARPLTLRECKVHTTAVKPQNGRALRYPERLRRFGACDVVSVLSVLFRFSCSRLPMCGRSRHTLMPTDPLGWRRTANRPPG